MHAPKESECTRLCNINIRFGPGIPKRSWPTKLSLTEMRVSQSVKVPRIYPRCPNRSQAESPSLTVSTVAAKVKVGRPANRVLELENCKKSQKYQYTSAQTEQLREQASTRVTTNGEREFPTFNSFKLTRFDAMLQWVSNSYKRRARPFSWSEVFSLLSRVREFPSHWLLLRRHQVSSRFGAPKTHETSSKSVQSRPGPEHGRAAETLSRAQKTAENLWRVTQSLSG